MKRLGVCIVGMNGAVASTVIAGVALMKKGLAPRVGMVTEGAMQRLLALAPLDEMVFGGWDLRDENVYEAALTHGVLPKHVLDTVKDELTAIRPWPAVAAKEFLTKMTGKNLVGANNYREEIALLEANVTAFKKQHGLSRVVMVNLTSTERFCEVEEVHRSIEAFEAGLDASDKRISPAMKYLYLACKMGMPHANFTPSLTKIPALEALSEKAGIPIAGEDGKTGQTMIKTVLASAFAIRKLTVEGWYSTNILGNNDGAVLHDPASNKTKVVSKRGVLNDILGYDVEDHQVHIHYYKPRGDAKEAWDNIDLIGFCGERMSMKVNFLCKDSILAAPLVLDMVRLLDVAQKHGEKGILRPLSLFFKAPYHTEGEKAVNDLFKQDQMLQSWIKKIAEKTASSEHSNGNGKSAAKSESGKSSDIASAGK